MEELDKEAIIYGKLRRDRRKAVDPNYKGPERRLGKRREMEISKIIRNLEREARSE